MNRKVQRVFMCGVAILGCVAASILIMNGMWAWGGGAYVIALLALNNACIPIWE